MSRPDFDLRASRRRVRSAAAKRRLALLQAGAEMLRTAASRNCRSKRYARKVGVTVGAFYSRFESKEAYFNALLALAARDGESRLPG